MTHTDSKEPKTLQTSVIKRALGSNYSNFLSSYRKARKVNRGNREDLLSVKLSEKENQIVWAYLNETDTPVSEIAERFGVKSKSAYTHALRLCARVLYQNKAKIEK